MKKKTFQKVGKEGWMSVPDEFKAITGMIGIKENGISSYAGGRFDKAYYCRENIEHVSNYEKVKGCTMLLRGAGVKFCFYELPEQEQKVLLLISVLAKTQEEAETAFSILEKDMQGNLYTFGVTIMPLSAEDKLYLMHRLIMQDAMQARIDVNQYLAKTSGWLTDFRLQHYVEHDDYLEAKEQCSCLMYVQKVPTEHVARVYQKLKGMKKCRLLVTAYESVTDQQVKENLQNNYIGIDSLIQTLVRKKSGVGKIEDDRDERRYVYAGIYFVLTESVEAELRRCKKELQEALDMFGGQVEEYQFYQKQTWQRLATLNPWEIRQTRLMQSGNIVAMNPFYQETAVPDSEELGSKAELLAVFDAMTEQEE